MAHFNFVISQNAKRGHAGFYIDCHRMTVPENILLQKSTGPNGRKMMAVVVTVRDRGIMRLCARIISRIIGDLPHN